jgi:hypothetical protein
MKKRYTCDPLEQLFDRRLLEAITPEFEQVERCLEAVRHKLDAQEVQAIEQAVEKLLAATAVQAMNITLDLPESLAACGY